MMDSLIYIDNEDITDPATNLAIEEYVLRQMDPAHDYLMLCRNEPSVIVGRNQNVLEEINDDYARKKGIRILRRLSGGGTVYHDLQNLNFSFITRYEPSRLHNFKFFNAPVVSVLRSLGVPAEMNDRNDILANGRKISGSAQFSSKGRMFSHGTLLFNSELDEVNRVLSTRMKQIHSKSHKSVRSNVANISGFLNQPMGILEFRDHLMQGLLKNDAPGSRYRLTRADREHVREIRQSRYDQWEWNIGRSPRFRISRTRILMDIKMTLELNVNKGHIENLSIKTEHVNGVKWDRPNPLDFSDICSRLAGLRYDQQIIRTALENLAIRESFYQAGVGGYLDNTNRAGREGQLAGNISDFIGDIAQLIYGEDD